MQRYRIPVVQAWHVTKESAVYVEAESQDEASEAIAGQLAAGVGPADLAGVECVSWIGDEWDHDLGPCTIETRNISVEPCLPDSGQTTLF